MNLYSIYERIPTDWIALAIGCLIAWLYLKTVSRLRRNEPAKPVLDLVSDVFFAYVLFSRFVAGLIVGFDLNIKNDLLSMINGSARYGWLVGIAAVVGHLSFKFYRRKELQSGDVLWLGTKAFLVGGVFVFAFLGVISLHPFRAEAVARGIGLLLLLFSTLWKSTANQFVAALVWIGISVLLLTSSMLVPQTVVWFWFTPSQWVYIAVMAVAYIGFVRFYNTQTDTYTSVSTKSEL